jgi:hypothetical protein
LKQSFTGPLVSFIRFILANMSTGLPVACTSLAQTALILVVFAFITQMWWLVAIAFVQGYAFAWIGHFFFEHNKPDTFTYPWFSFLGDWCLWWEMLIDKIQF